MLDSSVIVGVVGDNRGDFSSDVVFRRNVNKLVCMCKALGKSAIIWEKFEELVSREVDNSDYDIKELIQAFIDFPSEKQTELLNSCTTEDKIIFPSIFEGALDFSQPKRELYIKEPLVFPSTGNGMSFQPKRSYLSSKPKSQLSLNNIKVNNQKAKGRTKRGL